MRQDNALAKDMMKFMYGFLDYKLPEDNALKAVLFYSSDEDKKILEKNGCFCLDADCTKDDIKDAFTNKVKTYRYLGFNLEDLKMSICLEDYNIPAIYLASIIDENLFTTLNISPNPSLPFHFSEDDIKVIQSLIKKYIEKYRMIKISNDISIAMIPQNQEIDDIFIRSILETKYNIMDVFQEFNEEMTRIMENYARSNN